MEAKDLMIGDWVKFTSKYGYGTGQVVGIEPREGSAKPTTFTIWKKDKEGNTKFFVGVSKNCVKPIPLTAEILEKNGFVQNRGITSWMFETKREDLIDIYGVNEYHLSINIEDTHGSGKGYRWMLNNLVIFYVHELQHALKLCRIDKEIQLKEIQ